MNRIQKTIVIIVALILIAFLITAALKKEQRVAFEQVSEQSTDIDTTPMGKVAATKEVDGEYYVYIMAVNQSPEDTTLTMKHVTYFEGPEARVSAANEVQCEEAIENCVPTLRAGYYVRESGAAAFAAPLLKSAATGASIASQVTKDPETVYIVTVKEGSVVRVMQVTK